MAKKTKNTSQKNAALEVQLDAIVVDEPKKTHRAPVFNEEE